MRKYIGIILAFSLATGCSTKEKGQAAENSDQNGKQREEEGYIFNKEKPYPYETGIVEYKYTGRLAGTQTVYFKDHGRILSVEEDYTNTSSPVPQHTHQLFINTPDKYYFANLVDNIGYVVQRNDTATPGQVNLLGDITSIGIDSTMRKNGYVSSGIKDIAGKKCRVYKSKTGESEFCFWEGMNIRTQMSLGQNVNYKIEAVKINENAKVPDEKFAPPSSVKILDYKTYVKQETRDKL